VSHNARQVRRLCNRGLVLQEGRLVFDGPSVEATKLIEAGEDDDDDDL